MGMVKTFVPQLRYSIKYSTVAERVLPNLEPNIYSLSAICDYICGTTKVLITSIIDSFRKLLLPSLMLTIRSVTSVWNLGIEDF